MTGSLMPMAEVVLDGRLRQSPDLDDFRGGFAVWSGTSFAAPLFAGWLSGALRTIGKTNDNRRAALARVWPLITRGTGIKP
jgi:hypothetical protein